MSFREYLHAYKTYIRNIFCTCVYENSEALLTDDLECLAEGDLHCFGAVIIPHLQLV